MAPGKRGVHTSEGERRAERGCRTQMLKDKEKREEEDREREVSHLAGRAWFCTPMYTQYGELWAESATPRCAFAYVGRSLRKARLFAALSRTKMVHLSPHFRHRFDDHNLKFNIIAPNVASVLCKKSPRF